MDDSRLPQLSKKQFGLKKIIFLFCLFSVLTANPNPNSRFEHISVDEGLSNNIVTCIVKDRFGLMWFGTTDGLNKYDGYTFTVYKNIPADSSSLSHNWVTCLLEDHKGQLWVGTLDGGLCLYNRRQDNFIRFYRQRDDSTTLATNMVVSLFEECYEDNYTLWVNTLWGVNRYNSETNDFKRYYPETGSYQTNKHVVLAMAQDSSGRLWAGTQYEGLFHYDRPRDYFERYDVPDVYRRLFPNKNIAGILADRENGAERLWVGTTESGLYCVYPDSRLIEIVLKYDEVGSVSGLYMDTNRRNEIIWIFSESGLNRLDISTGNLIRYRNDPPDQHSISSDEIHDVYRDNTGILWIATRLGISKLNPFNNNFRTLQPDYNYPNSLSHREVHDINQTGSGDNTSLWIGTAKGLNRYEPRSGRFTHFYHDPDDPNSLTSNHITNIRKSMLNGHEELWVATSHGFNRIDPLSGTIKRFYLPDQDFTNANYIWSMCVDKSGKLWLGSGNAVLYSYDPRNDKFTRFRDFQRGINTLHIDSSGSLWIGTLVGLARLNLSKIEENRKNYKDAITWYTNDEHNPQSISSSDVTTIYEDSRHTLWFGTSNGLNKFDRIKQTFTRFGKTEGMPGSVIAAMLEDNGGNLWISTDHGITKFDLLKNSFKNYDVGDGLQGNMFWFGAFKNPDGDLYFCGSNGLTYFNPAMINENSIIPPVIITGFSLFNKPVFPGQGAILKEYISSTRELELTHEQSVFSFEFAALDYFNPQKNRYAYKMDGVDPDWVDTEASRRFVTYTNLDPGEYVFRVKGSNNDGIWNEEGTSIKVIILPPWWRTKWAYSIYLVMILAAVTGVYRFQSNRLRIRRKMEINEMQAAHLQELDRMKSRFFTNISHEFRTPLTLIKGPLQQFLKNEFDDKNKSQYKMMLRNTYRLLELVNQILDISKLEAGQVRLQVSQTDIVPLLKEIALSFSAQAETQYIKLLWHCDTESAKGYIDPDKITKIITNLVSNALKYTPEGGEIVVSLNCPPVSTLIHKEGIEGGLEISVSNTGPGIPPEDLDRIFDRFFQAGNGFRKDSEGSGIGLALVRELVDLHHGKISVTSEPGKQTVFSIWLPVDRAGYAPEEIVMPRGTIPDVDSPEFLYEDLNENDAAVEDSLNADNEASDPPVKVTGSASRILVVEDNPDVVRYIRHILNSDFRISSAGNGVEGLKQAVKLYPDLIISDVMMPEMDGFELCRRIKTDQRISHIPVILLTAKADMDSKIEGLEFGADDYLSKPFDADELRARIRNLIRQRQMLREKFSRMLEVNPAEVTATSVDEQFLERVIKVFENHISDPDLDTVKFAREVGLSRSQLNRKLLALTSQPVSKFLLSLRLKRAAQLIQQYAGNVTEIAYMVGFQSLSYFAKKFREQYGETPSQFAKKTKQDSKIKD